MAEQEQSTYYYVHHPFNILFSVGRLSMYALNHSIHGYKMEIKALIPGPNNPF